MSENNITLEKKRWYRFLKVVHIVFVIFLVLIAFAWAWSTKPKQIIDYANINCSNGHIFTSKEANIYLYNEEIDSYDDERIKNFCASDENGRIRVKNKISGKTGTMSLENPSSYLYEKLDAIPTYNADFVYKTEGSWQAAITVFLKITIVGILFIEIIRRTLLYIVVGKSFFSKNF